MEAVGDVLASIRVDERAALMLVFLLLFVPAMPFLRRWVKAGRGPVLRPIPGYSVLRGFVSRSIETGRPVHLSVGVEGVSRTNTAETLAGLTLLDYLAGQAAVYGALPSVSVADPTALLAAQDVLRNALEVQGESRAFDPRQVRMIAPEATAYAAGVMGILSREDVSANVMVGTFRDEYLLMGETGARKGIPQVAGAATPEALPFMYASAGEVLIGEEIFAGGAYLSDLPSHIASLVVQDWMRILLVLAIAVGVVLATVR